ncbi:dienelactone hydrolase family protein [Nakamurella silvestris]|nr:dienelactone hydrolase family protein [Nakamurella silvestris]
MPVTLARGPEPATGPRPKTGRGILVVQEAFGITPHIESICRRLARLGFVAAAPHLHHRAGLPAAVATDFAEAKPLMDGWTGAGIRADLRAGIAVLSDAGCAQVGIIGFCAGGSIALWAAATLPVAAAVSFYGGGLSRSRWEGVPSGLESAAAIRSPWLGVYGDRDTSIPVPEIEELRGVLAGVDVPTDVLRYAEAGHGFNNDTRPDHFHPVAAADAWAHAVAWFDAHLVGPVQGNSFVS